MLTIILYSLFILSAVVLIAAVLLQPGKADAGALFTSTVNSAAFGPRGTQTVLSKITIGAAIGFMLIALLLTLPGLTGPRSVMQGSMPAPAATPTPTPAPAASPAASPAAAAPATSPAASPAATPNPAESTGVPAATPKRTPKNR